MSKHDKNGSHYENHPRAAELHDGAAHAYRVGEHQGKQDHLTGHERSRQAQEHSSASHNNYQAPVPGTSMAGIGHDEIAALAHELWLARGCPSGSPQEDWFRALEQLRSRNPAR